MSPFQPYAFQWPIAHFLSPVGYLEALLGFPKLLEVSLDFLEFFMGVCQFAFWVFLGFQEALVGSHCHF